MAEKTGFSLAPRWLLRCPTLASPLSHAASPLPHAASPLSHPSPLSHTGLTLLLPYPTLLLPYPMLLLLCPILLIPSPTQASPLPHGPQSTGLMLLSRNGYRCCRTGLTCGVSLRALPVGCLQAACLPPEALCSSPAQPVFYELWPWKGLFRYSEERICLCMEAELKVSSVCVLL